MMTLADKRLVSIITVCYNSAVTIDRTIKSVLAQNYDNIEYIIIDGASQDNTLERIENYQGKFIDKFNREIRIVSEPDKGIYDAMNKGIQLAQGDFIGILNSDDAYMPEAVSKIISCATDDKLQVCYGGIRIFQKDILESIVFLSHLFLEERMIAHPACFVTKKVYEKYGNFSTKYKSSSDYEFMLRISQKKDVVFNPVYEPVADFYLGGKSTTCEGFLDKIYMLHDIGKMRTGEYLFKRMVLLFQQYFGGK
jgi:putative glycosyltransferase